MPTAHLTGRLNEVGDLLDYGHGLDVVRDIAPGDPMYAYPGGRELYFIAGPAALRLIHIAMLAARVDKVESILDYAFGGGRVLRTLAAAFPAASLTACDTWKEGVDFCADRFGARGVIGGDPQTVDLGGPFDLIWCGSLLTHVDRDAFGDFLSLFASVLGPGGILVFTTRGRYVVEGLRTGDRLLALNEDQASQMLQDYDATGFGYYANFTATHGECVASRSWICDQLESVPALELVLFFERGWMKAQDAVACVKA